MKTNKTDTLRRLRRAQLIIKELDGAIFFCSPKYPYVVTTLINQKRLIKEEIIGYRNLIKRMGWQDAEK